MRFRQSMLRSWCDCPLQMKFRELDELPEPQHIKTSFGTIIHFCLDYYLGHGDLKKTIDLFEDLWEYPEKLDEYLIPTAFSQYSSFGSLREKGPKIIENFHNTRRWEDRETVGTEHRFLVPVGDHELEGTVDLIEVRRDKKGIPTLFFVDFKTSSKKPTFFELHFNIQFTAYILASLQPEFWIGNDQEEGFPPLGGIEAFERYKHMPRKGVWSHLWTGEELPVGPRNEVDFKRFYRAMVEIERAIEHQVFVPNISASSCGFCPYKEPCGVEIEKTSDQIWLT